MPDSTPKPPAERKTGPVKRVIREVNDPGMVPIHPALIPGIGVERTGRRFGTNWAVFAIAGALIVGVIIWAIVSPSGVKVAGEVSLAWVVGNVGWLFSILAVVVLGFMLVLGYGPTGGVRLGADREKPEFSTISWIAMLFSAGMGIGLLFYAPLEPLTYFLEPPHGFSSAAGSVDAMQDALAQSLFHWGPIAWGFYALVGGAIAYSAYRRGRSPLISAIFEPMFGRRVDGWLGGIIDVFAIIVTLFGTAVSLGLGVTQIGRGIELVSGLGDIGNGLLIGVLAVLTGLFVLSAVSGVKRGIRILSNTNLALAGFLAVFIFVVGPTTVLLTMIPAGFLDFFGEFVTMATRNVLQGEDTADFMGTWTTYYWAWWISWSPFVGMFIAKISRGRTLREFVTVVILIPSSVCFVWFGIVGGTAIWQEYNKLGVSAGAEQDEDYLFEVLGNLPLGGISSIIAMLSIVIYFVTSADSASIVMGSMSQRGKPEPSTWVTITWGVLLGAVGGALLLVGGENALDGLQRIMIVSALPFCLVVIGIMFAWTKDLRTDPYMLRRRYANAAIAQGVRQGLQNHGDDFVFDVTETPSGEGAGSRIESEDPALSLWYTSKTGEYEVVRPEDIERTLHPGRIQKPAPPDPANTASGDATLTVGEDRRRQRADARRRRDGALPGPDGDADAGAGLEDGADAGADDVDAPSSDPGQDDPGRPGM